MTFVSMPAPETFFPICSTISTSNAESGSRARFSFAIFRSRRSPASRSAAPKASTCAVSSYPFSTMPSPKAIFALASISRPTSVMTVS